MIQGDMRVTDPHQGMQVGAAQVAVDEDDLLAQAGQGDPRPKVTRLLPMPPLPPAMLHSLILLKLVGMTYSP